MKVYKTPILSLAFLLIAAITVQAAELATAKVVEVTGTVTKYASNGQQSPLTAGDILKEGDSISVTALSEAELIFSNGSELTVDENTSVSIAKLQQEPFSGSKSYGQLQADPSKSQTLLELNYGKLSGHVKNLRSQSRFEVDTPLGTAAIRGTKWSAMLAYNAERGDFILAVKNYDGLVDIKSKYIGKFDFGSSSTGDKNYDASLSEETRESIPEGHTIVIRLNETDPFFDDLFGWIENIAPTGQVPTITPGPPPGPSGNDDDDFGVIVVSPEGTP